MAECGAPSENLIGGTSTTQCKDNLLKNKISWAIQEVIASVAVAVNFYNNRRPHMSIGMKTPAETEGSTGDKDM